MPGAAAVALMVACGTATEQSVSPTSVRCEITVGAPPQPLPSSGSTVPLTVSAARDCTWSARSEESWIVLDPVSGQGSASVAMTVGVNAQARARSAAVSVNDNRLTISQEAAPCRFELGSQMVRLDAEGGHTTVSVSTLDGCEWRASSSADWIRVTSPGGTGTGSVAMDVSRNGGAERSGSVSIAGLPFVVSQDGSVPPPADPPAPVCTLTIEPGVPTFNPSGGDGNFRVTTGPGCTWTASSNVDWIAVTRPSGIGSDIVTYRVAPNPIARDRSGTITVSGRTKVVIQQALGQGG